MKPSEKTEEMEQALKDMFGHDRRELIKAGCCVPPPVGCGREGIEDEFRNEISRREYAISGLCQKCQDEVFGVD